MPVGTLPPNKEVKRSPSLRSEQSSLSDSRHVSFNQDVSIKHIPKKTVKPSKSLPLDPNDEFSKKCQEFVNVPPPSNEDQIADEAEQILRQLNEIECSASPTPRLTSPVRQLVTPSPRGSRQTTPQNTLERKKKNILPSRLSKSSSDLVADNCRPGSSLGEIDRAHAMRVHGHSEQEDSPGPHGSQNGQDNRLYGLQALSNLDQAVNGKVNNLQRESYSPPPQKRNNFQPPKPPRKAPSASPPNMRKSYTSTDNLDIRHKKGGEMFESARNASEEREANNRFSYTTNNPSLNHLRNSPTHEMNSRQSPSRGNHTDSEILSSPTQVLYATISADKHKYNGNLKNQHIQTQTVQTGFRPVSAERQIKSRTSSKENILDDPPYRHSNGANGSAKHGSRSLERFVDDDKENNRRTEELKARIHVKSPMRYTPERQVAPTSRKPYKTTINTATDTIQYRGFTKDNVENKNDPRNNQKNNLRQSGKKVDTEHYKVPRNKAPVPAEFIARKGKRNEHELSQRAYNNLNQHIPEKNSNLKPQFASTSLVRNVDSRPKRGGEYDREGRRIHSERRASEGNRAYSGYSTSPERELSPGRYSKPRVGKINLTNRSPSSSPTRPPRTRSSPNREMKIAIQREHSGREVERSPSTRAAATSRSPIKKIQRVHNEIKGDRPQSPHQSKTLTLTRNKGDKTGVRGVKTILMKKEDKKEPPPVDRLSKFTEYKGTSEEPTRSMSNGRRGSTGHAFNNEPDNTLFERERGQSVPPGANIDSMRDFYKTSQYRSMYHLPPSPSRPAPVLERGGKTQTLERATLHRERSGDIITAPPRRFAKSSISEGEQTDDHAKQERVNRQRNQFLNNIINNKGGEQSQTLNRRINSSDREADYKKIPNKSGDPGKRNGSHDRQPRRPAPQPPVEKVRRSSVDVLETSHSESESPRPDQANSGVNSVGGGRWVGGTSTTGQSDVEADYRRDLATSSSSVHMEARTRDGVVPSVVAPPSIYAQAATLSRSKSGSRLGINSKGGRTRSGEGREVEISQDDEEDHVVRGPKNLSREEERRKIIELEEERRRKEMKTGNVSRSGSRATKTTGGKLRDPKFAGAVETENESQYSGHSSSSIKKEAATAKNRFNTGGSRVKRTGSTATSGSARQVISRKKMPGSVTSSVNSSESENGAQSAISRGTNQSTGSNRSVYLHATAVAEIPSRKPINSIDDPKAGGGSNLQKSKKISRSISLLAPFKKSSPKEKEVLYDSSGQIVSSNSGKPPRAPPPPTRRVAESPVPSHMSREKKFASSSDLLQDENEVAMSSGFSEQPKTANSKQSSKVSRSVSMPKDTRLAGWFKKRKRVQ